MIIYTCSVCQVWRILRVSTNILGYWLVQYLTDLESYGWCTYYISGSSTICISRKGSPIYLIMAFAKLSVHRIAICSKLYFIYKSIRTASINHSMKIYNPYRCLHFLFSFRQTSLVVWGLPVYLFSVLLSLAAFYINPEWNIASCQWIPLLIVLISTKPCLFIIFRVCKITSQKDWLKYVWNSGCY